MADAAVETAPADENDDNWLYGDSTHEQTEIEGATTDNEDQQKTSVEPAEVEDKETDEAEGNEPVNDDSHFNDEHFGEVDRDQDQANGDADSQDNGDSDSDDSDDVKVTIGEIKSGPQYASLNIKRGVGILPAGAEKPRPGPAAGNKVTLEDLDGPGSINGVPALEFNIDTIEDKPWNKPGADISDYFNYGFNEVTWSAYCERQRRMRVSEAGVSLHAGPPPRLPPPDNRRPTATPRHDEMPPGMQNNYQSRENTIQVMTAERREYGRAHGRDAPPPAEFFSAPPPDHYYPPPHAYDEPWGKRRKRSHPEPTGWAPTEIKELTPGPMGPPMGPPLGLAPPQLPPAHVLAAPFAPPYRAPPPAHHERERTRERDDRERRERDRDRDRDREREEERDRDRERERSRSIKPERTREKSYRRERSRSRTRRHKSRSRSPRQRDRERERSRDRDRSRERERTSKPKNKESKEKEDDK